MKHIILAALLALPLAAQATYCTNGAKDWPKCTPPATPSSTPSSAATSTLTSDVRVSSGSHSAASAGSTSGAVSGSSSSAKLGDVTTKATGGNAAIQGVTSSASGGTGGSLVDQSKSQMWVLPAPVFTPPLPMSECPQANVDQVALSALWNGVSYAHATVNTDNCTAIIIHNRYIESCQYANASKILSLLSAKVLPGFSDDSQNYWPNLTREQCEILKRPMPARLPDPLAVPQAATTAPAPALVAATCPSPAPTAKPTRTAKAKPKTKSKAGTCS